MGLMADFLARLGEPIAAERWMLLAPLGALALVAVGFALGAAQLVAEIGKLRERVARLEGRTDRQSDAR